MSKQSRCTCIAVICFYFSSYELQKTVKWRMSVSQETAKNCARQMHNAPLVRKNLELNFRGRNKDW